MGLLDYYRQFESVPEEEVKRGLREEARERKRKALVRVPALDLSPTTWPGLPHMNVVNAITFVARRGLQRYPYTRGADLRSELASRHGLDTARLIVGNGAAELLGAATRALIEPGQKLITPWPSYPLFPIMARRAHGQAVLVAGGVDELLAAVAEHDTRVVALASPNDPTGELFAVAELQRLLRELPDGVAVLLDEALVEFAGPQAANASLALLEQHPRLLVFRSFSKAWGLAGLRCGYALGGPGSEALLAELEPDLGVSEISQAAALEALRTGSEPLAKRVGAVTEQRVLLTTALGERHFDVSESQANFLWVAHPTLDGTELTARLRSAGILVAAGAALGEPRHIRVSLRDEAATTRLLGAIDRLDLSAPAPGER
ncbi:MAG: pyridoxal phosphate-dependent aminotransferase [Solirubrobacterales bacterium]